MMRWLNFIFAKACFCCLIELVKSKPHIIYFKRILNLSANSSLRKFFYCYFFCHWKQSTRHFFWGINSYLLLTGYQ